VSLPDIARRICFLSHRGVIAHFKGALRRPCVKIPRSARYRHDKKRESEGGNPSSGHENPEMFCLVHFTPLENRNPKNPSGKDRSTEN
jgi:hypothetical protein